MTSQAPSPERQKVFEAAKAFYRVAHAPKKFVPGETYIPVTAKVIDAEDLVNLLDASLDLWLTAGRFSREFEAKLPELFARTNSALLVNSGSSANLVAVSSLGAPMLKDFK